MKQKGICMKRITYIVTACAFLSVSTAKAQVLTLKECLEEGLQNNYSLRIVHNEEQIFHEGKAAMPFAFPLSEQPAYIGAQQIELILADNQCK